MCACAKKPQMGARDWAGLPAAVVGTGRSGTAAARLLHRLGCRVRVLDVDPTRIPADFAAWAKAEGVEILTGEHNAAQFAGMRLVVPSPGVPAAKLAPFLDKGAEAPEVLAEMQIAYEQLSSERILAITGTSGKTTTSSLAAAMLEQAGKRVFLGGNIGTPLSGYVLNVMDGAPQADVLVLEISSFQLQTCATFRPQVGVLLNISENHLDYHADMREYVDAKLRLFACQTREDLALIGAGALPWTAGHSFTARVEIVGDEHPFTSVQLFGHHNGANIAMAFAACRALGVSPTDAARAVAAFKPLPNRLERVAEKHGVIYVNDSKATTVDAQRVALEAFEQPIRLLAGGKFKGGDLTSLNDLVAKRVVAVYLFGASREIFEKAWKDLKPMTWDATLEAAVQRAAAEAHSGDVVLMAPATASFDLFANYEERGAAFRRAVEALS